MHSPEVVTQNIDASFVGRVNHEAVVIQAITCIEVVALSDRHVRQDDNPVLAFVVRSVHASVYTVCADASGIDDILVGGSNGDVEEASGFGKQGVARHGVARTRMAHQSVRLANVNLAIDGSHDSAVGSSFHFHGHTFDEVRPGDTLVGGIHQASVSGSHDVFSVNNGDVVHKRPSRSFIPIGSG